MQLGFYKESIVELEAVITEITARLDMFLGTPVSRDTYQKHP